MTSIADHLATINLTQYQARFAAEGLTSLAQLTALSDSELDSRLTTMGLLKGHAIKLRLSLDAFKTAAKTVLPTKTPSLPQKSVLPTKTAVSTPAKPVQRPVEDSPLLVEAQKITAKLVEIDRLKEAINKSKEAIMGLDVGAYRKVLDQIEALQRRLRSEEIEGDQGEVEIMDVEQTGDPVQNE